MRIRINRTKPYISLLVSVVVLCAVITPTVASALATSEPSASPESSVMTAAQQQRLSDIIARGNQEITRRLAQLNMLNSLITAAQHITASDKTTLSGEVSAEVTGLTTLKAKLDGDTTLAAAGTDAQSIITDYRVYALITPKVRLIKTADDQQTVEGKLTTLATKLQTRVTAAKTAGKIVTSLQTSLDDMLMQVKNAQAISGAIETKTLPLQPSDFNSDHTILSGDYTQLQTAYTANQAAYTDAKTIVSGLKSL